MPPGGSTKALYVITTIGGKPIKRSSVLWRLVPEARATLAEGWPVFLKSTLSADDSIEFTLGEGNVVQHKPAPRARPTWVRKVLEEFQL